MSCGGLVLDTSGAVLLMNGTAEELLRKEVPPEPREDLNGWSRRALKRLLSRAGTRAQAEQESWFTIWRDDQAPLVMHAIPLGAELSGPHTMLVLVDLGNRPQPTLKVLQRLFELTPAEARLAVAICAGKTLAEVGDETSLSNATLRTQLSSIFNKTQTRRQPELVSLLARVAILP
jgi:DNA-binding CsgD family transcriptional regulator